MLERLSTTIDTGNALHVAFTQSVDDLIRAYSDMDEAADDVAYEKARERRDRSMLEACALMDRIGHKGPMQ